MENDNQTMDRELHVSEQRKKRLRKGAYALAVTGALALLVTWTGNMLAPKVDSRMLMVDTVSRGTIEVSISAGGKVVPAFEETIITPIGTKVLEVYAHSGDSVDEGTPLLKLDLQSAQTEYEKQLFEREVKREEMRQAQTKNATSLKEKKMQIELAEMQLAEQKMQLQNERYLDSIGSGTTERVRECELAVKKAELALKKEQQLYKDEEELQDASRRVQQLNMKSFEKSLDETMRKLDGARIRSPRKATLTYLYSEVGMQIGAGTKVAVVSDLSHFKVECSVADIHSDQVMAGGKVMVKIGRERLTGSILSVTPLSEGGQIQFTVTLDNPSHPKLHSGLKADVYVYTSIRQDVLRLRNASYYSGKGEYTLFVFDEEGDLVARKVKMGECNFDYVEVMDGLYEGDRVVVNDMGEFKGKERLEVKQQKK